MSKLNIGDIGYFVQRGRNQVEEQCPDCAGKLFHHIVMGMGDEHDIPCDTCGGRQYGGSTGFIKTYVNRAVVKSGRVVSLKMGEAGVQEYDLSVYWQSDNPEQTGGFSEQSFNPTDVYVTEADANVKADKITAEQVERFRTDKNEKNKSWAWHVNYHRRAIRENLRQNVYHEDQLGYAKSKAKS